MTQLRDIVAYLCAEYPHKGELSRARLTKLVYLADWKSAIENEQQITSIKWYFDNYGPFVWDVWNTAESDPSTFTIDRTANMYGDQKNVVGLVPSVAKPQLPSEVKQTLDFVIAATKDLNWQAFIKLVYSTHPVLSSERYSFLDLVQKAKEYKESDVKA